MSLTPSKLRAATESGRDLESTQTFVGPATRFSLCLQAILCVGRRDGGSKCCQGKSTPWAHEQENQSPAAAVAALSLPTHPPPLCHLPARVASRCSLIWLQRELSFPIPSMCMSTSLLPPCPSVGGMDALGMHMRNYQLLVSHISHP